jgi:asparagine synthase (glutamine-hydrolysing)
MRKLSGDSLDLHAFSFVADDPALSEEPWIDLAGSAAKARVHKIAPRPDDLPGDLDRLIRIQGEPFVSTSIWAQHRVFALAREAGIKVMLDGQGADELLGGYHVYAGSRLASLLRQRRFVEAVKFLRRASSHPGREGLWLHAGTALPGSLQAPLRRLLGRGHVPGWLRESWFRERDAIGPAVREAAGPEVLREKLLETLTRTSLPMLLRYEDRSSMAESIESRVPFLVPSIASFVLSLPEEFIVAPDGTSKAVFRRAMRGIVPDAILDRRDKKGFATPEARWLVSLRPWVDSVLASDGARIVSAVLDLDQAREHWRRVADGRARFDARVWRWINLARWTETFGVRFE